ncbi:hypothetical protein BDV96DRAFT_592324 [Lophiotrema nucula]|uniref:Uncharacterized protein n=1 Tax=Lophiotrema nucula TaxID=690887 RepID=A0A6A5YF96_9PLEO|nr:hypothetical protein BDV96DRAFT_592324 [Lophiotrema nucula]
MNALVFATCDLTPEDWSDFAKAAGMPSDITGGEPIAPFVLVHARSPTGLDVETGFTIRSSVKTEFSNAPWEDIKTAFIQFAEPHSRVVHTTFFLTLDEQSKNDRRVVIVHKTHEYRTAADGREVDPSVPSKEEITKFVVWKRHRVPFEKACMTYCLLQADGGLDEEPYLQSVDREPTGMAVDRSHSSRHF